MARIKKPRVLSQDEIRAFREEQADKRDHRLEGLAGDQWARNEQQTVPSEVYILADKGIWIWGSEGYEYRPASTLVEILGSVETVSRHLLADYPLFDEYFTERVDELAGALAVAMGMRLPISYDESYAKELLGRVKARGPRQFLERGLFEQLVAYVGEHVRRFHCGRWVLSPTAGVFEPNLSFPKGGHNRSVWQEVYDALMEDDIVCTEGLAAGGQPVSGDPTLE